METIYKFVLVFFLIINPIFSKGLSLRQLWIIRQHPDQFCPKGPIHVLSSMIGYFLHDLLCMLPVVTMHPSDALHHAFGLVVIGFEVYKAQIIPPFVPVMVILESTSILLDISWFLRNIVNGGIAIQVKNHFLL